MASPDGHRPPPPTHIALQPLGTPLPLGFVGLTVASTVVAALNLGWIPSSQQHQVALVLVAFAFPLQGLAAVLCFRARDAPAGAGIAVQAGTWLTFGVVLLTSAPGVPSMAAAVFLFAAAAALVPAACTAAFGKAVPAAVMAGTALRFVLTGVSEKEGAGAWTRAAGWEGLVVAALALYVALATDLEASRHHTVLPLGRRGEGRLPPAPRDDTRQGPELGTEPGVRNQL